MTKLDDYIAAYKNEWDDKQRNEVWTQIVARAQYLIRQVKPHIKPKRTMTMGFLTFVLLDDGMVWLALVGMLVEIPEKGYPILPEEMGLSDLNVVLNRLMDV